MAKIVSKILEKIGLMEKFFIEKILLQNSMAKKMTELNKASQISGFLMIFCELKILVLCIVSIQLGKIYGKIAEKKIKFRVKIEKISMIKARRVRLKKMAKMAEI